MGWIDIATFNEHDKAEALKLRLEGKGLHPRVHDESNIQKYWFLSEPVGSFHVEVAKGEESSAQRWMHDRDGSEALWADAIHCPQCHSTRVEFPQFTRRFVSISILPILIARIFHQQRFYCEDCHHTWKKDTLAPGATHVSARLHARPHVKWFTKMVWGIRGV